MPVPRILPAISARRVIAGVEIDLLPVQPAVERTAVVEYAVQDHPDPAHVRLPDQIREEPVAGLEICGVCHPHLILLRLAVVQRTSGQDLAAVVHYFAKVGIYVVVILGVIFVIGW